MKKKFIASISLLFVLIFSFSVSSSAFSFSSTVKTTSKAIVMINMESETVVYGYDATAARYASTMVEIVDFIVVAQNVKNIEKESIEITSELLSNIPNSDGSLTQFVGKKLTIKDLLSIMMITVGNDAAYLLADYVSGGDIDSFTALLNSKVKEIGCKKTEFISPLPVVSVDQVVTCSDLYRIMKYAMTIDSFVEASSLGQYTITANQSDEKKEPDVVTNNSIKKSGSPYMFSYVKNSKFGYGGVEGQNICSIGKYQDTSYMVICLGGRNDSEMNVYTDTKMLLTWGFTKLKNVKLFSKNSQISTMNVDTVFGKDTINLVTNKDVVRTLPSDYEKNDIEIKYNIPENISLPIFAGQNIGTADVLYKGSEMYTFNIVSGNSKGISLIEDVRGALKGMYNDVLSETVENTESVDETEIQTTSLVSSTN